MKTFGSCRLARLLPRDLGPGVVHGEVLIFSRLPVPDTNLLADTSDGLRRMPLTG
jgi:hypothetical protein